MGASGFAENRRVVGSSSRRSIVRRIAAADGSRFVRSLPTALAVARRRLAICPSSSVTLEHGYNRSRSTDVTHGWLTLRQLRNGRAGDCASAWNCMPAACKVPDAAANQGGTQDVLRPRFPYPSGKHTTDEPSRSSRRGPNNSRQCRPAGDRSPQSTCHRQRRSGRHAELTSSG